MAQNIQSSDLCIVCNAPNLEKRKNRTNQARKPRKYTVSQSALKQRQRLEEDFIILPQLRPLFLLKEIFKRPMDDASDLLRRMGNPSEWFDVCDPCSNRIDQAIEIQVKMRKLGERLKKIKEGLCEKLHTSHLQEMYLLNDMDVETPDVEEDMMTFRTELRRIIPEICAGFAFATTTMRTEAEACMSTEALRPEVKCEVAYSDVSDNEVMENDEPMEPIIVIKEEDPENIYCDSATISKTESWPLKQKKQKNLLPTRILPDRTRYSEINKKSVRAPRKRKRKRKPYYYVPITEAVEKPDSLLSIESQKPIKPSETVEKDLAKKSSFRGLSPDRCETNDPDYLPGRPISIKRKSVKRRKKKRIQNEVENEDDDDNDEESSTSKACLIKKRKNIARSKSSIQRAKQLVRNDSQPNTKNRKSYQPSRRWKRLLDCADEYLDMSLITYPPKTAKEKSKIPKEFVKSEVGALKVENGEKSFATEFSCPSCGKFFNNKYFAISHIHRFHLGIQKHWRCNKCSLKFVDARRLLLHLKLHDAGKLLSCPLCNAFKSKSQEVMNFHVAYHQKDIPNPACTSCGKTYKDFNSYLHHMSVEHGLKFNYRNKQTIICELCSMTFAKERSLKYHQVTSHGHVDEEATFPVCPQCGKLYQSSHNLELHIQKDQIKAKNFFCDQCGLGFAMECQLKNHITNIHYKITPVSCHVCGFVLKNRKFFSRHMAKHHPEAINMSIEELEVHVKKLNEEKPHKCSLCGESFVFSVFLYHHYRNEHKDVTNKYKCDVCGKGYSRACSVKRHYETVHEKKTTICQYCSKEYPISSMYQHQRQQKSSCNAKRIAEFGSQKPPAVENKGPSTSSRNTLETQENTLLVNPSPNDDQQPQQFVNLNNESVSVGTLFASHEDGRWLEVPINASSDKNNYFLPHAN